MALKLFRLNFIGLAKNLGLYLTQVKIAFLNESHHFAHSLGLYLTRALLVLLSPFSMIIRMPLPPWLDMLLIMALPIFRILLPIDPVVFPFSQSLTRQGTSPLTLTYPYIRNEPLPTITAFLSPPPSHLILPTNMRWLQTKPISSALYLPPNPYPQMILTRSPQMILP